MKMMSTMGVITCPTFAHISSTIPARSHLQAHLLFILFLLATGRADLRGDYRSELLCDELDLRGVERDGKKTIFGLFQHRAPHSLAAYAFHAVNVSLLVE